MDYRSLLFYAFLAITSVGTQLDAVYWYDITTQDTETVDGQSWQDGDVIRYDPNTSSASAAVWETWFDNHVEIQALTYAPNGNILLSTTGTATIWGQTFEAGDIIEADSYTQTATLFFDRELFEGTYVFSYWSIDALDILDNGNILLSTSGGESLGGLAFLDGDLVEYNPFTDTASLFLSESIFTDNEDIDAVHVLDNGNILLSTRGTATIGGLTFSDGDLVEYDIGTGNAWVALGEDIFSDDADINGVYVAEIGTAIPEPQTYLILASFLVLVALLRRRRQLA